MNMLTFKRYLHCSEQCIAPLQNHGLIVRKINRSLSTLNFTIFAFQMKKSP
jgi:hypothetical protein